MNSKSPNTSDGTELADLVTPTPAFGFKQVAYSVKDVARLTGWPAGSVYDMVERGKIPVVRGGRTGRSVRILARDLETFLLNGGVAP